MRRFAPCVLFALRLVFVFGVTLEVRAGEDADDVAKPMQRARPSVHDLLSAVEPPRRDKWAESIGIAASKPMVERGIANAKEALLACQKEEGGVIGLSSAPSGRPSARTDHCFRQ